MKTSKKILAYITLHERASGKELSDHLTNITPRAIRKQLKNLLEKKELKKTGRPPKVFYMRNSYLHSVQKTIFIPSKTFRVIENKYLFITPSGEIKQGWEGFSAWCEKTKQDPIKTSKEYISTLRKYDAFSKNGLINGIKKLEKTFNKVFLDRLFYLDFYSIERFGKTKLGQMLLHAKQSQDKKLIQSLVNEIRPKITWMAKKYSITGVLFIPPTLKREVQFMKELEKGLKLPIKKISVVKIKTPVTVAQKTLSKLEDRVENAQKTIIVDEEGIYKNILIIDDAVGSGATLNETAKQIKKRGLCKGKITGLAITGSFKGFDVISEI